MPNQDKFVNKFSLIQFTSGVLFALRVPFVVIIDPKNIVNVWDLLPLTFKPVLCILWESNFRATKGAIIIINSTWFRKKNIMYLQFMFSKEIL